MSLLLYECWNLSLREEWLTEARYIAVISIAGFLASVPYKVGADLTNNSNRNKFGRVSVRKFTKPR